LWLLMDSTVLEEVAMADLFRTIALDVVDVSKIKVGAVGDKLADEEDKMLLVLVMMLLLGMLMVLQLKILMVLLQLMMPMVLQLKVQLTILTMSQVV